MPAEVALHPGTPAGLDALSVDALALPLFDRKAQPRHISGNVDWRMCGAIARLIRAGSFDGARPLLTPSLGRLGAERIFLFGLGRPAAVREPAVEERLRASLGVLADAGARSFAVAPPTAPQFLAKAEDAMDLDFAEVFLKAAARFGKAFDRIVILDAGTLRTEADKVKTWARDGGLMWTAQS